MGRRGGFRPRRGGRGSNSSSAQSSQRPNHYAEVKKENEKLERFYNELGMLAEDEKEVFWETMRRELPNSFRFTGSKSHALTVQQRLIDHYIPEIESVLHFGQNVEPPKPVKWYPNQLAWAMTTPKNVIRRFAPFASFQKFLVTETLVGNISRQELVSMIPPLMLDVRPGMTVLDLCAAPGSKTAQLIEMLHSGDERRNELIKQRLLAGNGPTEPAADEMAVDGGADSGDWSDGGRATGMLIANDVDYRRAQMLIHQTKRLNSPNLIVTNHDASLFPSMELPTGPGEPVRYLKYDRILADVPCSGDGTARKNPNLWKDWDPKNGLGLHLLQARILVRALQMLKPGGRMVYSTCSMNPVENEAVVAHAIERCGGPAKVRILDVSAELPGLERRAGMTDWKVMDKTGAMRASWAEVQAAVAEGVDVGRVIEEMFPPEEVATEEERVPLERCVRVYPHLQNTGGFFITALEKISEFRALPEMRANRVAAKAASAATKSQEEVTAEKKPEEEAKEQPEAAVDAASPTMKRGADEEAEGVPKKIKTDEHVPLTPSATASAVPTTTSQAPSTTPASTSQAEPRKNSGLPFEEPFVYLSPEHPTVSAIFDFYSVSPHFPRDRFMVRNGMGEPVKGIYYTSALVRDVLTANESKGLKFVHSGVKMFQKQDVQGRAEVCPWRVQAEGLPILDSWLPASSARVLETADRAAFHRLLRELFPRVGNGDDGEGWTGLGDLSAKIRDMSMGCCILRIDLPALEGEDEEHGGPAETNVLPLWRSINSVNLMLPKDERKAMLVRLYNDSSELVDCSKDARRKNEAAAAESQNDAVPTESQDADGELETEEGSAEASTQGTSGVQAEQSEETQETQETEKTEKTEQN